MAQVVEYKFEDNKKEVMEAMQSQVYGWLQAIGEDAADTSASLLYRIPVVDTGRLAGSISWATRENNGGESAPQGTPEDYSVYIGTNVEYAIYHEYGTGAYASNGSNAKKIPWAFQDSNGEWHYTRGVKARHYIQFGITAHKGEYKSLLEQYLKQ